MPGHLPLDVNGLTDTTEWWQSCFAPCIMDEKGGYMPDGSHLDIFTLIASIVSLILGYLHGKNSGQ